MLSIDTGELDASTSEDVCTAVTMCLSGHPYHRVFPHTWVVRVAGYGIYERLQVELREAAAAIDFCTVRFLMSPLFNGASYRGRIDQAAADALPTLSEREE